MNVNDETYRTTWSCDDRRAIEVIGQTRLPHEFTVRRVTSVDVATDAIIMDHAEAPAGPDPASTSASGTGHA